MTHSLLILSFNKLEMTRHCITSIIRETEFSDDTELIVVDNGSSDGSREWLRSELPAICRMAGVTCKVIENAQNSGCSTARNQGLEAAGGEYITFLDNDVAPLHPGWLDAMRMRMDSADDIGMVGAKMLYPAPSCLVQCAGVGISARGHVSFLGRGERDDDKRFEYPREVQALISACLMIRACLVSEYGGFDEAYNPVQFEDFDLCYRYRQNGWRAWYEPSARMIHYESTTTAGSPSINNAAVVIRNGLRFQRRWRQIFANEKGPPEEDCRWRRLT